MVRRKPARRGRTALIAGIMALFVVLTVGCVLFVDRPVEIYVAAHQNHRWVYQAMAAPSLLSLPLALLYLAARALGAAPSRYARTYMSLSMAVLVATALKDEMKWMFGRPWPEAWVKFGLYQFRPFTDNQLYGGFPSGHTAYIAAPLCMMCWLYPKHSALWVTLMAIVMFGLVAAGYHYVGDVVAGLLTGMAAAAGTVVVMGVRARK
jgi:membrane-associated phospholipid phosphatase